MNIIYVITYKCNLNCRYCPVGKKNESLSKTVIKKSLNLIDSNSIDNIRFFGGEPLIEFETVKFLTKKLKEKIKNPKIFLTTNGLLLDKQKIEWIKKNKITLSISLDGNEFTQLKNRKGANSFKKIIELLKYLPRETIINIVISPNTARYSEYNFKYLLKLGLKRFNILPAYYNSWSENQLKILEVHLGKINKYIKEEKFAKKIYFHNIVNYSDLSFFNKAVVVDCDGQVYNSTVVLSKYFIKHKKKFNIGNVFEPVNLKDKTINQKQVNSLTDKEFVKINQELDRILNKFISNYKKIL